MSTHARWPSYALMQTHPTRPTGPFRLGAVPLPYRTRAAESLIRREALEGIPALELKLTAISPSNRLWLLTGEPV